MSRKLKLSLIYFLFILLAGHAFAEVNLTHLVENIRPAVVTVITYDKDKKPLSQGSGFFIDANGHLVTNYHVLEGADHAEVKTYSGRKYPIKSVIGENKNMDLIKVLADISRSSVQWINVTGTLASLAERVVVVGSPMGLEQTVSEGIVSGVRAIPGLGEILQISAAISSGSSGSPVVNMKGQVVGIVSFYLMKGQSLNFAVPGQYLLDLKPSKTIKTISEWTYGVNKKSLRKTPQQGRLFVYIEPEGARVRIINIKPKFYQGIVLKSGSYHIEVSADGYEMEKMWIKIRPGETKNLRISLKNLPHLSIKNPDELVSMGIVYKNKGEYKKAIDTFKQAIRIDPNNSIAHYNLGIIYLHSDRQREAIEALKQTIRIDPYLARAYSGLGVSYGSLGLYRESIDAYKQAIKIDNTNAVPHWLLGVSYSQLNLHREAIEAFKQAIRIDPNVAEPHHALGIAYNSLGLHREAAQAFKQATRIDPDNAPAHYSLGYSYGRLGLHREAIEAFKQAIRIKPDNVEAYLSLGSAYGQLGLYREALKAYKSAVRIKPDDARAHGGLGISYEMLNNRGEALEQYKILKTLDKEAANKLFNFIYK
jgi:tetratricopeptide (TPR) repeat protein